MKFQRGSSSIMLVSIIMLITFLVSAAVAVSYSLSRDAVTQIQSERALAAAESGAEEGLLRLLRNPGATGPFSLSLDGSDVTITYMGTTPQVITSQATYGSLTRTLQVEASFTDGQLNVSEWQEI